MIDISLFNNYWKEKVGHLSPQNTHLLLAVSGGVDSVVMVNLAHKAGFCCTILHVNFQLRGEESTRDEHFVTALAKNYQMEYLVNKVNTTDIATENKEAIQVTARKIRYSWFEAIRQNLLHKYENCIICTAHHADDNIETVLMNFFRGTGIEGLKGIQYWQKEKHLLRPLLPFRKQAIIQYAQNYQLDFVEDSSNEQTKYTRNLFRNILLKDIGKVYPNVENNILNNIERLQQAHGLYEEIVVQKVEQLQVFKNAEVHIPINKLLLEKFASTLLWEIIKPYGFSSAQVQEVEKLIAFGQNGSTIYSESHRIIKNRNWLIISNIVESNSILIEINKVDLEKNFLNGKLQFTSLNLAQYPSTFEEIPSTEAIIDASKLQYPLLLRKWQTGDYFYPLGMTKKKKLSKFFIDIKLSKTDKEKVWVLESNKKIVWIVGLRIDDRFKITPASTTAMRISYLK